MFRLILASFICWQMTEATYYASEGNRIVRNDGTTIVNLNSGSQSIVGLAVDVDANKLFWSDILFGRQGIYCARLDGSNVKSIITDVDQVSGLTVDWKSKHIYWTDSKRKTVEVADYDGQNRRILFSSGMDAPRGIVADPKNQYLFWADQGTRKIERCLLDGTERMAIVNRNLYQPNQLAINFENDRLLWVDAANKTLMSCKNDGSNIQTQVSLGSKVGENIIFGLSLDGNVAYVSVWNYGYVSVSLSNSQIMNIGNRMQGAVYSLAHAYAQNSSPGLHQCGGSGHGCSHLCLPKGSNVRCACPSTGGMVLGSNKKTCTAVDSMLLYALSEDGEVGYIDPLSDTNDRYLIGKSTRPSAVAYDPTGQMVYWSDNQERRIYSARITGSSKKVVLDSSGLLGKVNGLAMDWPRRRLYFSNVGSHVVDGTHYWWNRIESLNIDNPKERQTVIDNSGRPQGLAVDIKENLLFYTDWSSTSPRIMRANLDGTDLRRVYTSLTTPNAVANYESKLFLVDSMYKPSSATPKGRVISMAEDGSEVKMVTGLNIQVPVGIAQQKNDVYVSDWSRGAIIRLTVDWSTKKATEKVVLENVNKPSGLFYTTRNATHPAGNVCENFGCDRICTPLPSGAKCSCPTNGAYVLDTDSDGKSCKESEEFLIVADMSGIKLINLEGDKNVKTLWEGQTGYLGDYSGLVYAPNQKRIYFSDSNRRKIYYGELNGKIDEFHEAKNSVDTLGIDNTNHQLYWLSTMNGTLSRIHASGDKNTYKLLATGLNKPRGLVIDPASGYVYWTECGKLVRSDLNGEGQKVVATIGKSGGCLTGLVLDSGKLYYADYKMKTVFACDVNGAARFECKEQVYLTDFPKGIYGLYKFGDFLYFTDIGQRTLSKVNMKTGKVSHVLEGMMRPTQIAASYTNKQLSCPESHRCGYKCQPVLGGYECMCKPGDVLQADGYGCSAAKTEWLVTDNKKCKPGCKDNMVCKYRASTVDFKCCKPGSGNCEGMDNTSPPEPEPEVSRFHLIIIIAVLCVVTVVVVLVAIFLYMKLRDARPSQKYKQNMTGYSNGIASSKYDRFETHDGTPPPPNRTYDNAQPHDATNAAHTTVAYANPEYSAVDVKE